MTTWEELQPQFRRAVLQQRREGHTMPCIADDIPAARSTVYRMMANQSTPSKALQAKAEEFVASHLGRSVTASTDE